MDAIKGVADAVALQGIEFWSTVCDEEADLAIELVEASESGRPPDQISRFYVKGAMQYLVPLLLETLAKQVRLVIVKGIPTVQVAAYVFVRVLCWHDLLSYIDLS